MSSKQSSPRLTPLCCIPHHHSALHTYTSLQGLGKVAFWPSNTGCSPQGSWLHVGTAASGCQWSLSNPKSACVWCQCTCQFCCGNHNISTTLNYAETVKRTLNQGTSPWPFHQESWLVLRSSQHSSDGDLNVLGYSSFKTAIMTWSEPPMRAQQRSGHMTAGCNVRWQEDESSMNEKWRSCTCHQHYSSQPQVCAGITRVRLQGREWQGFLDS